MFLGCNMKHGHTLKHGSPPPPNRFLLYTESRGSFPWPIACTLFRGPRAPAAGLHSCVFHSQRSMNKETSSLIFYRCGRWTCSSQWWYLICGPLILPPAPRYRPAAEGIVCRSLCIEPMFCFADSNVFLNGTNVPFLGKLLAGRLFFFFAKSIRKLGFFCHKFLAYLLPFLCRMLI